MSENHPPPLDATERQGFTALLDVLIPKSVERGLPGAGEAGLAEALDAASPDLRETLRSGLAQLDARARREGAEGFAALAADARASVVRALAEDEPGFLPGILFHTYAHYYRTPRVLEALGLEARPPYPLGYEMEPFDPEKLAAVRSRPPLYRDAGS